MGAPGTQDILFHRVGQLVAVGERFPSLDDIGIRFTGTTLNLCLSTSFSGGPPIDMYTHRWGASLPFADTQCIIGHISASVSVRGQRYFLPINAGRIERAQDRLGARHLFSPGRGAGTRNPSVFTLLSYASTRPFRGPLH